MEVNNYYPGVYPERSRRRFLNSSLSYSRSGNRYKYQTKEVDNYMDYNILDFGARHYDPATARWTAYDPASQYATPYISMGGNPVSGIDPDGRQSHRMSDAQASLAASNSYMDNINNGGQPMNYAMWSNVSSAGGSGGQTYYQLGLQNGTTNTRDIWRVDGKFYYNKEGAIKASNDILNQNNPNQALPLSNNGVKNGVPFVEASIDCAGEEYNPYVGTVSDIALFTNDVQGSNANELIDAEFYTKTGLGGSFKYDFIGYQVGWGIDIYSSKRTLKYNGSSLISSNSKIASFSANLLIGGYSIEYDYVAMKIVGELTIGPMVFGSSGFSYRVASFDYGIIGQLGGQINLRESFIKTNYIAPLCPIDNTKVVNPFIIPKY
jgi:RHS repeat-associated protein